MSGIELRALRRLKREAIESPFVFVSERGSPFTTAGYRKMIARLGEAARFSFPVHPHTFRHACGYKLANDLPLPATGGIWRAPDDAAPTRRRQSEGARIRDRNHSPAESINLAS